KCVDAGQKSSFCLPYFHQKRQKTFHTYKLNTAIKTASQTDKLIAPANKLATNQTNLNTPTNTNDENALKALKPNPKPINTKIISPTQTHLHQTKPPKPANTPSPPFHTYKLNTAIKTASQTDKLTAPANKLATNKTNLNTPTNTNDENAIKALKPNLKPINTKIISPTQTHLHQTKPPKPANTPSPPFHTYKLNTAIKTASQTDKLIAPANKLATKQTNSHTPTNANDKNALKALKSNPKPTITKTISPTQTHLHQTKPPKPAETPSPPFLAYNSNAAIKPVTQTDKHIAPANKLPAKQTDLYTSANANDNNAFKALISKPKSIKTPPPLSQKVSPNTTNCLPTQNNIPCKTFAELVKENAKLSSSQIPVANHDTATPVRLPGAARRNLTKTLGSPKTPGKRRGDILDEGSLLTSSKKVRLRDGLPDDDLGVSNLLSETPLFKSKVAIKIRDDSRRESLQKSAEMDIGPNPSPPNKTANPNSMPWQTVPVSKKPPSILLSNIQQIIPLIEKLNYKAGINNFTTKSEPGSNIRIHAKTMEAYKAIQNVLQDENIPRHSHQPKGLKGFQIVIRHLHQSTPIKWIESQLQEIGIATKFIRAMQYRDTKNPMRIHEVELVPKADGSHLKVLQLNSLGGQTIKVERKRVSRDPIQCHRCQSFGHTKNYCRNPFKCMKCGQQHATVLCNKPKHIPAYCANCKGNHVSSYKGCPVFQEAKQRLAVNKVRDQHTQQTQHTQPTHPQMPHKEKPHLPPTPISAHDTKLRGKKSHGKALTKRNQSINKRLNRIRTFERKPKKESSPPTTSKLSIATLEKERKNPKSVLNPANTHLYHFRPPPMAQNLPEEIQKNAIPEPNLLKRIESMEEKINNLLEIVTRLVQKDATGRIFPKNPSEAKGQIFV
ncbi:uncharacterized protein LOC120454339, partial [Drosophila santomea]|uniref:uncharacterized protein LOC120454339 n=1 Tax=Drosophila santomea TaxID=129105 RepID=UPI001CCAE1D6